MRYLEELESDSTKIQLLSVKRLSKMFFFVAVNIERSNNIHVVGGRNLSFFKEFVFIKLTE